MLTLNLKICFVKIRVPKRIMLVKRLWQPGTESLTDSSRLKCVYCIFVVFAQGWSDRFSPPLTRGTTASSETVCVCVCVCHAGGQGFPETFHQCLSITISALV